ncbi:hypothetical protein FACS189418_1880 [Clostridia bacterium]|nr:hypothetical protein FACS189418_1880 [Clostridia bacterium]
MGYGYLKIETRDYNGALPLVGAKVIISSPSGEVLGELTTNNEGETEYAMLYAPDKAEGEVPGDKAYAEYNIQVSKNGYVGQNIIGAKVFDQVYSTQPISLKPKNSTSPASETLTLPKKTLPIGEEGEVQTGPKSGGRALNNVIIPETVTVHMGTPSSSAKNITVPYREYIKNVASSEIYPPPVWPQAAVEANIYAIISITLNRIYTEWYRSQGYNFDITNSTAYDQYFVEGQTIPDTISQIVDRIFNQYVRQIGFKEPLFTTYCDGKQAKCNGLSQWGTVDLANSGLNAFQILQYYYGNNFEVVSTNNISDILSSYPGYNLQNGYSGAPVLQMQNYLNRIRSNYPAIPQLSPDGIYGPTMIEAVKKFQEIFNLPQTGVVDQATWNKISYVYTAVTKLAELGSEGEWIDQGAAPPTSVIQQGAKGQDVAQLQFLLNSIGGFYQTIPPVIRDSSFSTSTTNAVKAFQQEFGLTPDGIVGPATWRKLYEIYQSLPTSGDNNGGGGNNGGGNNGGGQNPYPSYPGTVLKNGSKGSDVELMQRYLNALADDYPSIPKVTADGIFGPATAAQVAAFQRLAGLSADGIIGPATWAAIISAYREQQDMPSAPAYPGYLLRLNSTGESVRILQTYLNRLAAQYSSIPRVSEDGVFGPGTQAAVIAAQNLFGLSADGIVGPSTWNAIVR